MKGGYLIDFPSLSDDNSTIDEKLVDASVSIDMTGTKMETKLTGTKMAKTDKNEEDKQLPK